MLSDQFQTILSAPPFAMNLAGVHSVAVGVSGGPDSMALLRLVSDWAERQSPKVLVYALTVDHGLRAEAAGEAKDVAAQVSGWSQVEPVTLRWEGEKPKSGIMEIARRARYHLMAEFCAAKKIKALFLAHHRDDQAETFLFRLAKGSGLDGLAGMLSVQSYNQDLLLLRPLLEMGKDELIEFCKERDITFIDDPSNESLDYARPRLRRSREVLEAEGLSAQRLSITAQRIGRARGALEYYARRCYEDALVSTDTDNIVFNLAALRAAPQETSLRCLLRAVQDMNPQSDFPVRMQKLEKLADDLLAIEPFRKRTLAGLVFQRDDKQGLVIIEQEK